MTNARSTMPATYSAAVPTAVALMGCLLTASKTPAAQPSATLTAVHSFAAVDGGEPVGPPVVGADGNLYGVMQVGGEYGFGTIYKCTPSGTFTTIYSFHGLEGINPNAGLALGPDGDLYGVCGSNTPPIYGHAFKVSPSGVFTDLHAFQGKDGEGLQGPLLVYTDGSLYGVANGGGANRSGTQYRLSPDGTFLKVADFPHGWFIGGGLSYRGTTMFGAGFESIYTTSADGGPNLSIVFPWPGQQGLPNLCPPLPGVNNGLYGTGGGRLYPAGMLYNYNNVMRVFGGHNGAYPSGSLVEDAMGYLYGTAPAGGASGLGTVFVASPFNSVYGTVWPFSGPEGAGPNSGLCVASDGVFYGICPMGGSYGRGTLFRLVVPIAPPSDVAASWVQQNGPVTISWTPSLAARSFNIYRGQAPGGEGTVPYITGLTGSTYTDTGITIGTKYYYTVQAVNSNGSSVPSKEVMTISGETPADVTAIPQNGSVQLTWNAVPGATSYSVNDGPSYTQTGLTTTSTVWSANNGSLDCLTVAMVNSTGTSQWSAPACTTPNPPPTTPTGLTAKGGVERVVVTWNQSSVAYTYDNIYRSTKSGGEGSPPLVSGLSPAGSFYIDTAVTAGTTYYCTMTAVNNVGQSPPTPEESATPIGPPSPPTVAATGAPGQVVLSWSVSEGAVAYHIYRGATAGGESSTPTATATTTSYTDTGLTSGLTYYYTVQAVDGAGNVSSESTEVSATPMNTAPSTPANLTAVGLNGSIGLTWTATTGATSYNIYGGIATNALSLDVSGVSGTNYVDTGRT